MKRTIEEYSGTIQSFKERLENEEWSVTHEEYCSLMNMNRELHRLANESAIQCSSILMHLLPDDILVSILERVRNSVGYFMTIRLTSRKWYRCIGKIRHLRYSMYCKPPKSVFQFLQSVYIGLTLPNEIDYNAFVCVKKLVFESTSEIYSDQLRLLTNLTSLSGNFAPQLLSTLPPVMQQSITKLTLSSFDINLRMIRDYTNLTRLHLSANHGTLTNPQNFPKLNHLKLCRPLSSGVITREWKYTGYAEVRLGGTQGLFKGYLSDGRLDKDKPYHIFLRKDLDHLPERGALEWNQLKG